MLEFDKKILNFSKIIRKQVSRDKGRRQILVRVCLQGQQGEDVFPGGGGPGTPLG